MVAVATAVAAAVVVVATVAVAAVVAMVVAGTAIDHSEQRTNGVMPDGTPRSLSCAEPRNIENPGGRVLARPPIIPQIIQPESWRRNGAFAAGRYSRAPDRHLVPASSVSRASVADVSIPDARIARRGHLIDTRAGAASHFNSRCSS